MFNYGLEVDGIKNDTMPCLYLSKIIDVRIENGSDLNYEETRTRLSELFSLSVLTCIKFRGRQFSDSWTGLDHFGTFTRGNGKYFRPSPFWNFKAYCYEPVPNNTMNGVFGLEIKNEKGQTTFIAASGMSYAEDFRVGEIKNTNRLYFSSPYALKGDMAHFYASDANGHLVRASFFNGNVVHTSYDLNTPIFSIAPPTQEEESELANKGRIFYVK